MTETDPVLVTRYVQKKDQAPDTLFLLLFTKFWQSGNLGQGRDGERCYCSTVKDNKDGSGAVAIVKLLSGFKFHL